MRILIVTTWFPDTDHPGTAPFNVAHAKAIATKHDVHTVHIRLGGRERSGAEDYAGLSVTRVPVNPRRPLAVARSLVTLLRFARQSDVVHSMAFSTLGVLAFLYPVIASRWVHTEHWSMLAGNDHGPILRIGKTLLRLPRRLSAVSESLATALRPSARRGAVDVIPNVIGEHFTCQEQPAWSPLKLVAVGGLIERKRPILAVDTVAKLIEDGEQAELTWVGDGPERAEVTRHAAALGIEKSITLTGPVDPRRVPEYIAKSNVFFLPTRSETFLVAAAEAIACGRPVVLPELPCVRDYVTEENSVLVNSDAAEDFSEAIKRVRDNYRNFPARRITATLMARFSESAVADGFEEFYRQGVRNARHRVGSANRPDVD